MTLALADLLNLRQQELFNAADTQRQQWQQMNDLANFDLLEHPEYLEDEFHAHDKLNFDSEHKSVDAWEHRHGIDHSLDG